MASTSTDCSSIDSNHLEVAKEFIVSQLKKEGIHLWLAPYTVEETGEIGQFPVELVQRYSSLFRISQDEVAIVIETLRKNAVTKFNANRKFKACGIATIKLKFIDKRSGLQGEKMETGLHVNGSHLREKIKVEFKLEEEDIKLICHGKIITNDKTLEDQGVHNNSVVMVICSQKEKITVEESTSNPVSRTKHAANILASKKRDGEGPYENYYLEISDQNGKPLKLPDEERKSLVLAMTLHEQGKMILKQRKFTEALVVLLGADEEFRQCRSEVLNAVDNYAILCLDIVWCYLQLKSIKELPEAEEMLRKCEVCLKKSYGENLERLASLTGGFVKEKVLYVRLYLLQAICAFHKGEIMQASTLLDKVEKEMNNLRVDDSTLSEMMSMGFSASASRLALRACNGDITTAVGYISRKNEERKRQIEERKENKKKHKLAKELGKTVNGEWINVDTYNTLREMGFPDFSAKESLGQANNDMNAALQILQERPELLQFSRVENESYSFEKVSDDVLAEVTAMGFDVNIAKSVLEYYHGDVRRTIEKLLESGGVLPPECEQMKKKKTKSEKAHTRNTSNRADSDDEREIEEALKEITPAFDDQYSEESHLDLTLDEEATYVNEYRTMIVTRSQMKKNS